MFLGTYELPGGPGIFESGILLYIIILTGFNSFKVIFG